MHNFYFRVEKITQKDQRYLKVMIIEQKSDFEKKMVRII